MANEYLERTPTSTGNRRVFTWSGWVKKNEVQGGFGRFFESGFIGNRTYFTYTEFDEIRFTEQASSSNRDSLVSNYRLRDCSSLCHVMIAVNSTLSQEHQRVKIYINGSLINNHGFSTGDPPGLNAIFQHNETGETQYIGNSANQAADFMGSMSDIFHIDGQALTPDVFGFYKEGKGYQSSGSTQATDFCPGQWSPKAPRIIKSEINRKGGFGVNGYYLPMNDSSNFGADFHTTPNSIIKLKGEDLQQPRNGLPTTSDNYVSQLRQEVGTLGFDGVVKFDGTDDNLSIPSSSDFAFGTGDFTIEFFTYLVNTQDCHFYEGRAFQNLRRPLIRLSSGSIRYYNNGADRIVGPTLNAGRWYHIAVSRSSGVSRLFVNGNSFGTYNDSIDILAPTTNLFIGSNENVNNRFVEGFISNLRVVKGTAVYTTNFTVPTEPLTNITNTKLLCCNSSTSATSATVTPATITANSNPFATRNELTGSVVLAVPGVNTQPTGYELVTNGTFDTDVSGWTITDTGTIVRQSDGTAEVTRGSSAEVVYQTINTVVGTTYELSVDITAIAGSHGQIYVRSTYDGGSLDAKLGYSFYPGTFKGTFTADTTQTRIILYAHPSGSTSYDNISVKETTISEYSADIKGSGTNKTFTPVANAGIRSPHGDDGFQVHGYYGSALHLDSVGNDCLVVDQSADFNLADEDYTIEGWYYDNETAVNTGSHCFWAIGGVNSDGTFAFFYENNALMLRGKDVGQAYENIIYVTNHGIPVKQWNHLCVERVSGRTTLYLNGVALQTTTETTTIAQGSFTIGAFSSSGGYAYNGWAQDVRVYKGVAKYKGGFDAPKPFNLNRSLETWRQVPDTCKNNFATLNPLDAVTSNQSGTDYTQATHSNGNLTVILSDDFSSARGSIGISTGKYYWEIRVDDNTNSPGMGVIAPGNQLTSYSAGANGASYEPRSDRFRKNGVNFYDGTNNKTDDGLIVGVALDKNVGIVSFFADGTLLSNGTMTGLNALSDVHIPECFTYNDGSNVDNTYTWNFGQNPTFCGQVTAGTNADASGKGLFKYAPPTGFLALCEDNLPTPAIADPGEHFKCVLWTGINDTVKVKCGFQPDFVWIKNRDYTNWHSLYDSIRGPYLELNSNETSADRDRSSNDGLRSFDSDGFTSGLDDNTGGRSGDKYVAWCWKAGGAAVPNTDGSITSQVSANQTAGFSIVSYTGTGSAGTVGHGLGKRPKIVIVKRRDASTNWPMFVDGISNNTNDLLQLNLNNATATAGNFFNSGNTTTTTFPLGTGDGQTNASGSGHIAYCWAEIEGYSKFGSYVGNGNANGPFVYCGFKPAWVMVKNADDTGGRDWGIQDSSRASTNPCNRQLKANQAEVENSGLASSTFQIDMLSNGFKVRNNTGIWNNSGNTIIFMAFAESPFQTANAK